MAGEPVAGLRLDPQPAGRGPAAAARWPGHGPAVLHPPADRGAHPAPAVDEVDGHLTDFTSWSRIRSPRPPNSRPVRGRQVPQRARKLRSRSWPQPVRMLSGWNCTPSTSCSRWRTPMIVPSAVVAVTSRLGGQRRRVDRQRVVAGRRQRRRQAGEHAPPCGRSCDVLPCISSVRADDRRAVDVADRLVAEAHAEHRRAAGGERRDGAQMIPASSGRPGPGESSTPSGSRATRLVDGEGVVAVDDRLGAELAEVLDEVEDEAVVAVEHEHPGHVDTLADRRRRVEPVHRRLPGRVRQSGPDAHQRTRRGVAGT